MGVPIISYTPETSWEFGAAAQTYFCLPEQDKTSILQLDGAYAIKKQWYINTQGTLYFGGDRPWQLQYKGGYSDKHTGYYGTGNVGNTAIGMRRQVTPFVLKRGYTNIQTRIYVNNNWSIGPLLDFQYHNTDLTDTLTAYPVSIQWGLGVVAQYDTRDRIYYPTQGMLFKTSVTYYEPALGSTTRMALWDTDIRQFVPMPYDFIWAWQLHAMCAFSAGEIPYPVYPCLGGQDALRGISKNMFRDDIMLALQTELRIPVWTIFRATLFVGVGDVYDMHRWNWAIPKVSYGIGLRASVNRAKVNIRFDLARSNIDPRWDNIQAYSFYLTATEAF